MTTKREEYPANDAAPAVLYAKRNSDSKDAYPLIADNNGRLILASLVPESYDYISLDPPAQPTTILYKSGGASGTLVATLTLTYSGTNVATVART